MCMYVCRSTTDCGTGRCLHDTHKHYNWLTINTSTHRWPLNTHISAILMMLTTTKMIMNAILLKFLLRDLWNIFIYINDTCYLWDLYAQYLSSPVSTVAWSALCHSMQTAQMSHSIQLTLSVSTMSSTRNSRRTSLMEHCRWVDSWSANLWTSSDGRDMSISK